MPESIPQKQIQSKAELIAHWRSTAKEIRSEIAAGGLDDETNKIVQINPDMLEACANQLEALPKN